MLPKTKAYVKSYDSESKCMYSSAKNDDLLIDKTQYSLG